MTLNVWIIFLAMETTACLSPGPAVLLVMSQGLSRGVLASMLAMPKNEPSIKVLTKCGFNLLRYEPALRRNHYELQAGDWTAPI